ncbi:L-tyrosine/L-tryptophan isonitrile synthase family protein [Kitasatospora sp. NPDC017646]|uniref:L-tyrosine/L-tryptophan isonitrile synthase family protein n=1 Tax=Kitasatospora sp. NPDC017646 TaxID=3364024 RepID=UPI00378A1BDB
MSQNPSTTVSETELSDKIVNLLYHFRRSDRRNGENTGGAQCLTSPCDGCREAHRAKLAYFIRRSLPIHLVLPAFPAKSPNRTKVLGGTPDYAEFLGLSFLQGLCDYIRHFHPAGARITICSDGHVFGDVVGVEDDMVTEYRRRLADMIKAANWSSLDLYGLDDAFSGTDYPKLRQVLELDYAPSLDDLKESVRTDANARSLFNGIHRFMFEDAVGVKGDSVSRTALRNESKERAYRTISRSNAWSAVVAEQFPRALRLSIHPQPPHSEKIGVRLLRSSDEWLTPWHGVVLDDGTNLSLVKKWDAEKLDASVVWRDGRPSHYVAPPSTARA